MIASPVAPRRSEADQSLLRDTTVLVTGCNTGIGRELARQALAAGASVVLTCRTAAKLDATASGLLAEIPGADVRGYVLEMESQVSVDDLCDALERDGLIVDTLILSAGVHVPFGRRVTPDGHELHHQVNFLSPARLFLRLARGRHAPRRVLYVSSDSHRHGWLPAIFPFTFWSRYARSKLLAATFFLSARPLHPDTTISVMSPGKVLTEVDRHKPAVVRWLRRMARGARSAALAASQLIDATFHGPRPEEYRNGGRVLKPSRRCLDPALQLAVWNDVLGGWKRGAGMQAPSHVIRNHAGNVSLLAPTVRRPGSEAEVAELVRGARRDGRKVRVVGAGHSYNDCFYSHSELVSLERLSTIGPIDEARATVEVGAGVRVQALCDHLQAHGYALRWSGNSGAQTFVGAALTGTHGYHRDGGLLAQLIVAMRVVTGTGEIIAVEDESELRALRVSLGTLGVVTSVTVSLVRSGAPVRYDVATLDDHDLVARIREIGDRNEYFRFHASRYRSERLSVLTLNPAPRMPPPEELERIRFIEKEGAPRPVIAALRALMGSRPMHRLCRRLPLPRLRMSLVVPYSTLLFVNAGVVNRLYRLVSLIYQAWNDDRTRNMELAIRPRDLGSFLAIYRRLAERLAERTGRVSTYFTGRWVGASEATLLGPNNGRDVLFVDVHVMRNPLATEFLRELEASVAEAIPVRPHWGKEFAQRSQQLERAYPQESWSAFRAAKERYDPHNLFSNAYTRRVFGW